MICSLVMILLALLVLHLIQSICDPHVYLMWVQKNQQHLLYSLLMLAVWLSDSLMVSKANWQDFLLSKLAYLTDLRYRVSMV